MMLIIKINNINFKSVEIKHYFFKNYSELDKMCSHAQLHMFLFFEEGENQINISLKLKEPVKGNKM